MIRATKAETAAVVAGIEPMLTHRAARSKERPMQSLYKHSIEAIRKSGRVQDESYCV